MEVSRRLWIAGALGAVAAGACVNARPARALASQDVNVLHAGSLTPIFKAKIGPGFDASGDFRFAGEGRGSVANARFIKAGLKNPDVFVSSDADVMRDLLATGNGAIAWYATFATTRIVIAYSPKSTFAASLAGAAAGRLRWIDVLAQPGIKIGRTDPAIDPLGYRTIIACKLAEQLYSAPGAARKMLGEDRNPEQLLTDEGILARLDQGELDAAFIYAIESAARGYAIVDLPASINLGDATRAAEYARASMTVDSVTHTGAPIEYALSIPVKAPDAAGGAAFVSYLLSPASRAALDAAGLSTHAPRIVGDANAAPAAIRRLAR